MPLLHLPNETLLHIASYLNPSSLVHLILTNHLLNVVITPVLHTRALEPKGSTPALFWAVIHGHEPLVTLLLQKGVDVNYQASASRSRYPKGASALYLAAYHSMASIAKLLLDAGADPNNKQVGHYDTTHLLLEADAKVNISTPIATAIFQYDVEMVEIILSANPDLSGGTEFAPFYQAYRLYSPGTANHMVIAEIVRLLVEAGADVNERHMDSATALHDAAGRSRNVGLVRILLAAGADVSATASDYQTPLHLACGYLEGDITGLCPSPKIVKLLLDAGADVNAREMSGGFTPLHIVVNEHFGFPGANAILRMLVENGADLNAKTNVGKTAYDLACSHRNKPYMKFLKEWEQKSHVDSGEGVSMSWFQRFRRSTFLRKASSSSTLKRTK